MIGRNHERLRERQPHDFSKGRIFSDDELFNLIHLRLRELNLRCRLIEIGLKRRADRDFISDRACNLPKRIALGEVDVANCDISLNLSINRQEGSVVIQQHELVGVPVRRQLVL